VRHKCYVGRSPQTHKDASDNLLTGVARHWMVEDYWGDWTVDRKEVTRPPDMDEFTHIQQPLTHPVVRPTKL